MAYSDHLERYCGPIAASVDFDDLDQRLSVVKVNHSPAENMFTFSTNGLSYHDLYTEDEDLFNQEAMICVAGEEAEEDIVKLLWFLSSHAIKRHAAFYLGEFYALPPNTLSDFSFSALYVTSPFYFPQEFLLYEEDVQLIIPVWFIPIFPSEEEFIEEHGHEEFDELLFQTSGELLNLYRSPLV